MTNPTPVLAPKSAIGDIIAKLEKASGPDRDLDALIMVAIGGARQIDASTFYGPNEKVWSFGEHEHESSAWNGPLPYVTASLDASLALVEEKLPGWRVAINGDSHRGPPWAAAVKPHGASWPAPAAMCMSWTPARAVMIALFRALGDGASSRPIGEPQREGG